MLGDYQSYVEATSSGRGVAREDGRQLITWHFFLCPVGGKAQVLSYVLGLTSIPKLRCRPSSLLDAVLSVLAGPEHEVQETADAVRGGGGREARDSRRHTEVGISMMLRHDASMRIDSYIVYSR